jgi:leucyl-tRNA synthetase
VTVPVDADEESARAAALAEPRVASYLEGKNVKKVIYVKAKIINFIVG